MAKEKNIDVKKIEELQLGEQSLQNLLMQKQVFQLELAETTGALEELKKTKGKAFKIVGSLMVESPREELEKELKKKKELLELRVKSIDRQEKELSEQIMRKRSEILKENK